MLHESGPALQRQEQGRGPQTGGQTGQLRPALGPTGAESGDEQLPGSVHRTTTTSTMFI